LNGPADGRGRTALVLSAGGMFGAYQAGAWSALQGAFTLDMVIGASIGSLNGWLIAGGCSAAELESRWLSLEAASQHRWRLPRRLSDGFLDPTLAEEWIQQIYQHCSPVVRYGLVATEMRTMRPALFEWPHLTWQHLGASCGVPVFLRQHRIDGRLYADGGLVNPLPLWAAVKMGATRIIAVNVLKNRPLIVRAVAGAARAYSRYREESRDQIQVVEISPSEWLGSPRESMYWSRDNAARWISLGKRDTDASKHLVVECFERV
jgi:NTE family protein